MVSIDTNIIVRFLTHDDKIQFKKAYSIFSKHNIFIPDTVILETEWVLRYAYQFQPVTICNAFIKLFGLKNVHLSNPNLIAKVIDWYKKGLDFSDAFHLANSQQCQQLFTFDTKFIKAARVLSKCTVKKP
ncbi:MAG: type II toxin-antitoxin system VapC family toxin [Candidatus Marinimicrobia bacterium]|nr:type II toxin-antitoxin system VapC family toxin [Candidatus Neomarinimicrobiota bacterium]MCH8068348.1 type II toxin-antitoxin system VapC family toxin [Candidatus Neomarinimicrobiota bacterium]